jgi:hypothetical protein
MTVKLIYYRYFSRQVEEFGSREEALLYAAVGEDMGEMSAQSIVAQDGAVLWDGRTEEGSNEMWDVLDISQTSPTPSSQ